MSSITDRFWRGANKAAVWVYRRTGGKVGGRAKGGSRVLLLTAPGRKSGRAHTVRWPTSCARARTTSPRRPEACRAQAAVATR